MEAVDATSTFFLEQADGMYSKKKDHTYYYQVRVQMKFSSVNYCTVTLLFGQKESS